ncbi:hypothetical protein GEMRC1_003159 [Eukaryota sp. GEM-RC1]
MITDCYLEFIINSSKILNISTRIVALSDCCANGSQIARWLGVQNSKEFQNIFNFSQESRVPDLDLHFSTFEDLHPEARFISMIKPAYVSAIRGLLTDKNVVDSAALFFCPSANQTLSCAYDVKALAQNGGNVDVFKTKNIPVDIFSNISNEDLSTLLVHGIGLFNTYLTETERDIVVHLYQEGFIGLVLVESEYWLSAPFKFLSKFVVILDTVFLKDNHDALLTTRLKCCRE